MIFKALSPKNDSAPRRNRSDAGMIVILMMALVFVPIMVAHAAMAYATLDTHQLAEAVNRLFSAF